jgi:hypothetical protein
MQAKRGPTEEEKGVTYFDSHFQILIQFQTHAALEETFI